METALGVIALIGVPAILVYDNAKHYDWQDAPGPFHSARAWGLAVLVVVPVFLPLYFVYRAKAQRREEKTPVAGLPVTRASARRPEGVPGVRRGDQGGRAGVSVLRASVRGT